MICFATHLRQTPAPLCEGGQGWGKGFEEWVDKIDIYGVLWIRIFSQTCFSCFFFLIWAGQGGGGKSSSKRDQPILFFSCDTPPPHPLICYVTWLNTVERDSILSDKPITNEVIILYNEPH